MPVRENIFKRIVVISDHSANSAELGNENRAGSQRLDGKSNELSSLLGALKSNLRRSAP